MSPHNLQTLAIEAGYATKAPNGSITITQPHGLYWLCHAEGLHASIVDLAFGLRTGTVAQFTADANLPSLTGYTGKHRPEGPNPLPPGVDPTFGSGMKGTQGPTASHHVYKPNDPIPQGPTLKEQFLERWRVAGWRLPADDSMIENEASRLGVTEAQAREWLS